MSENQVIDKGSTTGAVINFCYYNHHNPIGLEFYRYYYEAVLLWWMGTDEEWIGVSVCVYSQSMIHIHGNGMCAYVNIRIRNPLTEYFTLTSIF